MTEKIEDIKMKYVILETWKNKLGYPLNYKDIKELKDMIDYYEGEIQELKKQLEEYQLQNIDLRTDIMIQKKAFPNKEIKDKTFYNLFDMPTYEDLLNQQKEFMNYINAYIELLKDKPDLVEEGQKDILEEVLSKYKSIIGVKDE